MKIALTDWLEQVGVLTHEHREARARDLAKRGARRRVEMRKAKWSDFAIQEAGRWYSARARGYRFRIESVLECGGTVLRVSCQACGLTHDRVSGCRVGLLCVHCRGAIAAMKRAAFLSARASVLAEARMQGLLNPFRPKGRYSEKFLTLTGPHLAEDTIESRIARILDAWTRFLKRWNAFLRERCAPSVAWFRVFEWTPGDDELGHPHIHLWIFSPFLPFDDVRAWWRTSLCEVGCAIGADGCVIVDLQEVRGADGGARELIKYLTKDITSDGEKLAPELYARVYKMLDGRRATQASLGFMARADRGPAQCACGARLPKRVQRVPKPNGEPA